MNDAESNGAEQVPVVCRYLRTKVAFGTLVGHPIPWQAGASATAVYWCLRTTETAGPDESFAHPHVCRDGRACYEGPTE